MIVGSVNPANEAIIAIQVRGRHANKFQYQAIIDTGFNDWLALPRAEIERLDLAFREEGQYILADNVEVVTRLFLGEVDWFGRARRILVSEMEGGPLVGMAMLKGCYVGIEVSNGGRVEIRALSA